MTYSLWLNRDKELGQSVSEVMQKSNGKWQSGACYPFSETKKTVLYIISCISSKVSKSIFLVVTHKLVVLQHYFCLSLALHTGIKAFKGLSTLSEFERESDSLNN